MPRVPCRQTSSQQDEKFAGNGLRTDRPSCVSKGGHFLGFTPAVYRLRTNTASPSAPRRANR